MGLVRAGLRSDKYLSAFKDNLIALKFVGIIPNQTTKFDDREVTRDVVRANVISFSDDGTKGTLEGELLVHPALLAEALRGDQANWHGGVLVEQEQANDSSRTVYVLMPPESQPREVFDAMERTLADMGL